MSIEFRWGTGGGAQMPAFASELIELRSRCQRSTLSSTISARNLPCSAVMRPTVMGRRKRRGPALPGLKECAVLCLDLGLVRMTIDHRVDVVGGLGVKLGQNV